MTVDKEKLKALAEAATPGEWAHSRFGVVVGGPLYDFTNGSAQGQIFTATGGHGISNIEQMANADFIAAANPEAVLALLAEIERLKAENERLRKLPTCWSEVIEQSEANDQLLDKVLSLSADAERYRWLRSRELDGEDPFFISVLPGNGFCNDRWALGGEDHEGCDRLLDAAMTKDKS